MGIIKADTLTGSSTGDATFTGSNVIGTLAGFTNTSGDFALNDTTPLTITGTLDATGHTATLTDTGGGIDASAGVILANELTGSTTGDALFTDASNQINTLGAFTNNSGPFTLTDSVPLTVTGQLNATGQTVTLTDAAVDFATTVNGAFTLDVMGSAKFDDEVGGTTPLASLDVTGTTNINTDLIHTSGTQLYSGAVTLSSNSTVEGSTVTFGSTLDGPYDLFVGNFVGNVIFDGEVGQIAPLHNLAVSGTADINTDKITASNEQDYEGAVRLASNSTLTVTNGDLNFD